MPITPDPTSAAAAPEPGTGSPQGAYTAQARGGGDSYAEYYAGMDRSMQQKVALTTAYFPVRGVLADMGSGSGAGSFDLASLHRDLRVIGVDVAPEAVAHARAHYRRENLAFQLGDIADPLFPPESLDGILNSSVWHHLTSFNGFDPREIRRCLDNQTAALRPGGVLIVRDFVVPRGPAEVLLDLPVNDGAQDGDVTALSTAAAFARFAAVFRSSQNLDGPVPYTRLGQTPGRPGFVRFRLAHRAAAEFVLHKDYRTDWDAECREEYLYFAQPEFERELRGRGLRVVVSVELRNPWIVENRFRGRFHLSDTSGRPLPYPPTNYLIVGEKVAAGQGVYFDLACKPAPAPSFLNLSVYAHTGTGQCFELAQRPGPVIDLIPWFRSDGRVYVVGKQGFPRPLVNARVPDTAGAKDLDGNLDGAHVAGYLTEPISAMSSDVDATLPTLRRILTERAGIAPEAVRGVLPSAHYYTSPGGINERVTACLVELAAPGGGLMPFPDAAPNYTAFKSAGRVRPLVATQLLRAAQVGGLLDARLELNTYELLHRLGEPLGPWIGAEIALNDQVVQAARVVPTVPDAQAPARAADAGLLGADALAALLTLAPAAPFEPRAASSGGGFLGVYTADIVERDASGGALCSARFEFVAPRPLGTSTLATLPVVRVAGEIHVGLERRELPAVQALSGSARLLTAPAWRLPHAVQTLDDAEALAAAQLARHFRVRLLRAWPLGGKYYPATGATPEVVYPLAVEVAADSAAASSLSFVPLRALLAARARIEDGHLLIALHRLAHAVLGER